MITTPPTTAILQESSRVAKSIRQGCNPYEIAKKKKKTSSCLAYPAL